MGKPKTQAPQMPAVITAADTAIMRHAQANTALAPVISLADAIRKDKEIRGFIKDYLSVKEGDYGIIPGTPKPTLLQPGAQKLTALYGLTPRYPSGEMIVTEDFEGRPPHAGIPYVSYTVICRLERRNDLTIMGEGIGVCHTYESRYLYRNAKRACPACGAEAIMKSMYPDRDTGDIGWYCNPKGGGCKANFVSTHIEITGQEVGRSYNDNILDLVNTVAKIGAKRSLIMAVNNGLGLSGIFTQDLEDIKKYESAAAEGAVILTQESLKILNGLGILNEQDTVDVEYRDDNGHAEQQEAKQEGEKKPSTRRSRGSSTPKPPSQSPTTTAEDVSPETGTAGAVERPPTPADVTTPTNGAASGAVYLTEPPAEPTPDEIAAMMSAKANSNYSSEDLKTCVNAQYGEQPTFNSEMCRWVTGYMTKFPLKKAAASVK